MPMWQREFDNWFAAKNLRLNYRSHAIIFLVQNQTQKVVFDSVWPDGQFMSRLHNASDVLM